jgi:hypothetical protein
LHRTSDPSSAMNSNVGPGASAALREIHSVEKKEGIRTPNFIKITQPRKSLADGWRRVSQKKPRRVPIVATFFRAFDQATAPVCMTCDW